MWEAWSGAGCYEVCRRGSPGHLLSLAAGPWLPPRPFPQTMLGGTTFSSHPSSPPFPLCQKASPFLWTGWEKKEESHLWSDLASNTPLAEEKWDWASWSGGHGCVGTGPGGVEGK